MITIEPLLLQKEIEHQKKLFYKAVKLHILGHIGHGNSFYLKKVLKEIPDQYDTYYIGGSWGQIIDRNNPDAFNPVYIVALFGLWHGDMTYINLKPEILDMSIEEFDTWFEEAVSFRVKQTNFKDLSDN